MGETAMENVLAAIDASVYATSVCGYAGWAASRLSLPVELLHVVQRQDAVTARKDLSGAIGLGVKSDLMEELVRSEEHTSELQSLMRISYAVFCLKKKKSLYNIQEQ